MLFKVTGACRSLPAQCAAGAKEQDRRQGENGQEENSSLRVWVDRDAFHIGWFYLAFCVVNFWIISSSATSSGDQRIRSKRITVFICGI